MGYRGKVVEQERARELRAGGMTLADIAAELAVSKSSVSIWVRDVPFTPSRRRYGPRVRPNKLMVRKQAEIAWANEAGSVRVGQLTEREFLMAGAALYAGEGSKTDGSVKFTNSDPRMISTFCAWLRRFFEVDEARLRLRIYLHDGLDLEAASAHWADLTKIPCLQHHEAYRAKADATRRNSKHPMGCATVTYSCSKTHREVMGIVQGLLTCDVLPG